MVITKVTAPVENSASSLGNRKNVERQENETKILAVMGGFFCDLFSNSMMRGV